MKDKKSKISYRHTERGESLLSLLYDSGQKSIPYGTGGRIEVSDVLTRLRKSEVGEENTWKR